MTQCKRARSATAPNRTAIGVGSGWKGDGREMRDGEIALSISPSRILYVDGLKRFVKRLCVGLFGVFAIFVLTRRTILNQENDKNDAANERH